MTRESLPLRRQSITRRFEHRGMRYYGTVGYYEDWRPGEIFLDAGKAGADVQHIARDAAVTASLALQNGATLEELRTAVTRLDDGSPAGPLGVFLDLISNDCSKGETQ